MPVANENAVERAQKKALRLKDGCARQNIISALCGGESTIEDLRSLACPTDPAGEKAKKALSSHFTIIRAMEIYPVVNEDKKFAIISEDEWDAMREEAAANRKPAAKTRTPKEKLEVAARKVERAEAAVERTTKALDENPKNMLCKLKKQYAEVGLKIAQKEQAIDEKQYRPMVEAEEAETLEPEETVEVPEAA